MVQRALHARNVANPWLAVLHPTDGGVAEAPPTTPSVREVVFAEALYSTGMVRLGARQLLRAEVLAGGDLTRADFLADRELPDHGATSLGLLGYPDRWFKRPYVAQGRRLFARCRRLQRRIDSSVPGWEVPFAQASEAFLVRGEVPAAGLVLEAVLAEAELVALMAHASGATVDDWLLAFDRATRAPAAGRSAAVAVLAGMVVERGWLGTAMQAEGEG
ncbi:MAG: hypothetical protein JNK49_21610 [Planctomycetes bacterium]|nr:hypothetical protein [Planctomycetota bacterium]